MKVYISPSEQEYNKYAYGNFTEEEICHRIGNCVQLALHRCGIECKKAPLGQHMEQNITESNAYRADIHLCIHTNAANGKCHGAIVFVSSLDDVHKRFAVPVYDELDKLVKGTHYGVRAANYAEIRQTMGKCIYCECDFHDNPERAKFIVENIENIAEAITKGLCTGAGIKYVEPSKPTPAPSEPTEADTAKERAAAAGIMKGNGRSDYWTTSPTREQLAIILLRLGVI